MSRPRFAIAVHGGAGRWKPRQDAEALAGVAAALQAGAAELERGGTALAAAVAAVVILEDHPAFNAGTGSALNARGEAEMDAAVMLGSAARFGGVCAIRRVKNPVLVAKAVMNETPHALLAGDGARAFARACGFGDHDPVTEARVAELNAARARGVRASPMAGPTDTVGAVALDTAGQLAAATSTGGVAMKLPGRVGDSPLPGAGTYATTLCAASATGLGEAILCRLSTRSLCDLVAAGRTPDQAISAVLEELHGADAGFIAVDANGRIGVAHNTRAMPHAFLAAGARAPTVRMR